MFGYLLNIFLVFVLFGCSNSDQPNVEKFVINGAQDLVGVGSGLDFKVVARGGRIIFYSVNDSGGEPLVVTIRLDKDGAQLDNSVTLNASDVDLEGVAHIDENNVWLIDEGLPSLILADTSNGEILERYTIENGLPGILSEVIPNRAFEGVAYDPKQGLVYLLLQGVLDINKETKKTALFNRIIEFNPKTLESKSYAYSLGKLDNDEDVRLNGLSFVSKGRLIALEQLRKRDSIKQSSVVLIDLNKAQDISSVTIDDKILEYIDDPELLFDKDKGIVPVHKEKLFDLEDFGWSSHKAEGIALFSDKRTIYITNDNESGEPLLWKFTLAEPLVSSYFYKIIAGCVLILFIFLYLFLRKRNSIDSDSSIENDVK